MAPVARGARSGQAWRTAYVCLALRVVTTLSASVCSTALLRTLESNVCRNYYRRHDPTFIGMDDFVAERHCKNADVQASLSNLRGAGVALDVIPALLAALPYLILIRTVDKRLLLLLNIIGTLTGNVFFSMILYFYNTFDPRLMWLNGFFAFIGGGSLTLTALIQALIAESIPSDALTTFYFHSSAILVATNLLGSATGLQLMRGNPWPAIGIGLSCYSLAIPLLSFLDQPKQESAETGKTYDQKLQPKAQEHSSLYVVILEIRKRAEQLFPVLIAYTLPMAIIFLHSGGDGFRAIQMPWMSKRYGWTLREVGYVLLVETVWMAFVLTALPYTQKMFFKNNDPSSLASWLVKTTILLIIAGTVLLGLSWDRIPAMVSLAVLACGSGFHDAFYGYITAGMNKAEIGQIYLGLHVAQTLGSSIGGFLISELYSICVGRGTFGWMGVPFWACSGVMSVAALLIRSHL